MKEFWRSPFAYYLLWAVSFLLVLVLPPWSWSPLFIFIFALGMVLVSSFIWRSYAETRKAQQAFAVWEGRLRSLAATIDVEDDGHLYEWLDPPQWEAVFSELERAPLGSRSLRKAMQAVDPGALP